MFSFLFLSFSLGHLVIYFSSLFLPNIFFPLLEINKERTFNFRKKGKKVLFCFSSFSFFFACVGSVFVFFLLLLSVSSHIRKWALRIMVCKSHEILFSRGLPPKLGFLLLSAFSHIRKWTVRILPICKSHHGKKIIILLFSAKT